MKKKKIEQKNPSLLTKIYSKGIDVIIKFFLNILYDVKYLLFCAIISILLWLNWYNTPIQILLICLLMSVITALLYEAIRKKWFPRNIKINFDNAFHDYRGNLILNLIQTTMGLLLIIVSFTLVLAWIVLVTIILIATFPWCLLLLLF
jgi:hypothetical protein